MPADEPSLGLFQSDLTEIKRGQAEIIAAINADRIQQANLNASFANRERMEEVARRVHDHANLIQANALKLAVMEGKVTGIEKSINDGFDTFRSHYADLERTMTSRLPTTDERLYLQAQITTSARHARWLDRAIIQAIQYLTIFLVAITLTFLLALLGLQHFDPGLLHH